MRKRLNSHGLKARVIQLIFHCALAQAIDRGGEVTVNEAQSKHHIMVSADVRR